MMPRLDPEEDPMLSTRTTGLAVLAVAVLAACGGGAKPAVSVSLKTTTGATSTTSPGGSSTAGADLGNGIALTELRMIVRRITLFPVPQAPEAKPTPADMDTEHPEADDRDDFPRSSFGPFAVDAAFTSTSGTAIQPVFDADVDKGTYAGARIAVNTLDRGASTTDPILSALQGLHASIVVDGTIDGQAFEFKTPMRVAQWKKGPIVVGEGTTNLTLDVNASGWFTGPDGTTRLDPRSGADRGEILENIRCSIRLIQDRDRDGKPDDGDDDVPEGCGGGHGHAGD